ncbi:MAG: HAMP domain-containing histidine kinase [Candidatus Melainabacteria bacterium]|nr:HAMP domain-containing histidine kinase [Candidatus Melainabacteria bacterium]
MMRLNLKQKGLIIVSVPLIFEAAFILSLFLALEDAQEKVRKETKSRLVLQEVNNISKNIFDSASHLVTWNFTHKRQELQKFDKTMLGIADSIDNLKAMSADNPVRREHAKKLEFHGKATMRNLIAHREKMVGDSTHVYTPNFQEFRRDFNAEFDPFLKEAQILAREEESVQQLVPQAEEARKTSLRILLLTGFGINIAAAVFGAMIFNRDISSRLSVLIENSQRMAIGKELLGRISGQDEVALLDKVFHNMSESLRLAEATKREFVQMISHDLRTPLTAILGTFELLVSGAYGKLTPRGHTRVIDAERESERLISMINELLDIDKLESGNMQLLRDDCQLQPIFRRATEAVQVIAETRQVKIETTQYNPIVNVDEDRIVQIIINLLGNAVKYSPEGGLIKIDAVEERDFVRIDVIDQGPGIPKKDKKLVFERFKQIEGEEYKRSGSSGLGLAICKSLVESHGGVIGVDSEAGKGSRFWFTIKKAKETDNSIEERTFESPAGALESLTIGDD